MEGIKNEGESMFYKPIKKNKMAFFKHKQAASSSKENVMKDNCFVLKAVSFLSDQTV